MLCLNHAKRACLFSVAAVLIFMFACAPAFAQTVRFTEYSAKFLCGTPNPANNPFGLGQAVRPATYATTINIHNPGAQFGGITDPPITFVKKAVIAPQEGQQPHPPSAFVKDVLNPDFAEEVDCPIIYKMTGVTPGTFIEGYFVIYAFPSSVGTASELDVTDVVTANPVAFPGFGITLEMQTIAPRFHP
jgi:hypothetical protein